MTSGKVYCRVLPRSAVVMVRNYHFYSPHFLPVQGTLEQQSIKSMEMQPYTPFAPLILTLTSASVNPNDDAIILMILLLLMARESSQPSRCPG